MIIDRDKHNKYVVGWKPNYTVPTNQDSSSGTNVTIVYGGGGSGSSTPVSSEAFSYYKVSDGENAITQEAKVQKDIANLSIIGDEGIKVELITDPTIFEASFASTGINKGVYKISYGKVTTVVEQPTESETQAEEPTEPEVVITFPMTITYVSGEKINAEQFDTLRLLNNTEEVATYPSSSLVIEGDADGILSISLEVYKEVQSVDEEGKPVQDAEGNPVMEKQGLYFNRILLTSQLEDQPSTQAEGDSTEEEPQQPTYESLLSFDVVVNIDTVIKLSSDSGAGLWKLDDNGNIYTEYNAYSLKELSAYGLGEGESGEGAGFLHELGDVNIPDPNAIPDNAILQYNIETGKWEATELGELDDTATREWVEQKFKDLINGAPADLDTLGEIAIAIQELQQLLDWFSFVDGRIRANYNFWGVGEISAYGPASGSDPGTGGGAGYLHELGDVTINNDTLADGQIIVWDEDSQMWVNVDFPGLDEDALALYLTQNKYATQEWVKGQLDPINNKLEEFQTTIDMINDMFEWDNGKIKAKATLYSVGEISAYGAGEGSSGTGGYLHELDDVLLTSLQDDQLLMYDATTEKWVNVDKDEVGLNEAQLAQYLTEHNYAIMSNVVPITRRIIAGDGLQGGGPLSSDVTLSMAPLTAADIPGLDWSKIISGKPTTLAGYGITDGVNAVSVTGTGNAVTTASISGHTLTLTKALSFALITGTNATGTWPISITGNAATASKWATARTITLAGSVTGSTSIDGSGNVTITTTYTTSNISALDGRYVNVTGDTMTGNLILPTLQANTSIILGSVKLEYDSASNALKISNINTQQVINLYATGEISAYGYNSGSAGGGASTLNDLDDVTLSNLQNGQALVYNSSTGQWVNSTIQAGGIDEAALAQYLTNNQYLTMPTGDARYVTISTDQTITGIKTFTRSIYLKYDTDTSRVYSIYFNNASNSVMSSIGYHNMSKNFYLNPMGSSDPWSDAVGKYSLFVGNNKLTYNTYPILTSNNYSVYTDARYVTLGTTQTISGAKTFSNHIFIRGSESNDIFTVFNSAGSIKTNNSGGGNLTAIVHALSFKWYDSDWQIGNIRSDSVESKGFGITKGNSNLVFRVDDTNGWLNGYPILTSNNYTSYIGNSFVKKAGDTMTGALNWSTYGVTSSIYSQNQSYFHYTTSAPQGHWFNTTVRVMGQLYAGPNYDQIVWNAGNDGSGSGLDADLLDGLQASAFYNQGYVMFERRINASSLNVNTWYPVCFDIGAHANVRIECRVSLNSGTKPSWSTHAQGFSVRKIWEVNGSGWGTNPLINRRVLISDYYFADTDPVRGIGQNTNSSIEYVYVRGGGVYYFYLSHNMPATLYTNSFTSNNVTIGPTTTTPDAIVRNVAYVTDNVASANQLATARTINGTAFNGTSNIVTSYWGTARTLSLTGNATGSVSMNGSANVSMSVNVNYATSAGNADTLDRLQATAFFRCIGNNTHANWNDMTELGTMRVSEQSITNGPAGAYNYGQLVTFNAQGTLTQLYFPHSTAAAYIRTGWGVSQYYSWLKLATVNDNVASATKLQTARNIWGQSFNGTANVSGNMTGVGSITASSSITITSNGYFITKGGWFQNSTSGVGLYNSAQDARWYATSSGWISDKKINANAGLGVSGTTTLGAAVQVPYVGSSWISMATRTNLIYSTTNNSTDSAHALYRVKANNGNALCFGGLGNNLGFYAFTAANISSGTNAVWKNTYWNMTNWTLTHGGVLHCTGGIYSDSYVSALGQNSSDARLKTHIQDFKATSLIKQLHPKSFEWNDFAKSKFEVFKNTGTQYGLIAQDVKEVMPEWVDDNLIGSGYMGIRYDKLIPVLLQGEIETISRVETLEDKVRRLETENSKLKAKLSKLERRIR